MNSMEKLSCWSCSWGQAHRLKGTVLRVISWLELSERCGSQLLFCERRIWILVYLRYDRWARSTDFIAFSVVSLLEMRPDLIRIQPRTGITILRIRVVSQLSRSWTGPDVAIEFSLLLVWDLSRNENVQRSFQTRERNS